ncbi:Cysteine protease [Entamoeba marina]
MYLITITLTLFVLTSADQYLDFLNEHQYSYNTIVERIRRRLIFEQTLRDIEMFNSQPHSFYLGVTQFADKDDDEFRSLFSLEMDRDEEFQMLDTEEDDNEYEYEEDMNEEEETKEYLLNQDVYGRDMRRNVRGRKYRGVRFMRKVHIPKKYRIGRKWKYDKHKDRVKELEDGLDFRKFNKLTYIREQTGCGGCWSFASVCAIEARYLIDYNITTDDVGKSWALSEQQLLDCCIENNGCEGGSMERAYRCVNRTKGLMPRSRYPYEAETQDCKEFNNEYKEVTVGGYALVPRGNERALLSAIHHFGVLGIGVDTRSRLFKHYRGGVYYNEECTRRGLSHAMNLVGYGTTKEGQKYYIIRNSWGDWKWGEDGYMRIYRGNNHCGVATNAFSHCT